MAFLREYAAQGDPYPIRTHVRAGRLGVRIAPLGVARRRPMRRMFAANTAGDPFKFGGFLKRAFKPPKAVRKLTLGKALAFAKNVAPFVPGIGPALGAVTAKLGRFRGIASYAQSMLPGGGPDSPAPELVMEAPMQGTVGDSYYEVPGIEVSAQRATRYRQSAPVYEDIPEDEDEDEDYEDGDYFTASYDEEE